MSEQSEKKSTGHRVVGRVVSDKGDKTITVLVERIERHALYGKMLRRSTKLRAHDESNQAKEGDMVAIVETRPLSATKRSEEHTSELQSLMRISYAVFCLKKKRPHKSSITIHKYITHTKKSEE